MRWKVAVTVDDTRVQGTTDSPAPQFYSAQQMHGATDRIHGYNFNGSYKVPGSRGAITSSQRLVQHVITELLAEAAPASMGSLHLSEIRTIEAEVQAIVARRDGKERDALLQVLAILQATYANGGDNDEAGSITNTEHLLLDLEALHQRWAESN